MFLGTSSYQISSLEWKGQSTRPWLDILPFVCDFIILCEFEPIHSWSSLFASVMLRIPCFITHVAIIMMKALSFSAVCNKLWKMVSCHSFYLDVILHSFLLWNSSLIVCYKNSWGIAVIFRFANWQNLRCLSFMFKQFPGFTHLITCMMPFLLMFAFLVACILVTSCNPVVHIILLCIILNFVLSSTIRLHRFMRQRRIRNIDKSDTVKLSPTWKILIENFEEHKRKKRRLFNSWDLAVGKNVPCIFSIDNFVLSMLKMYLFSIVLVCMFQLIWF